MAFGFTAKVNPPKCRILAEVPVPPTALPPQECRGSTVGLSSG